jgi:transcriptional regulator with XRE-family HTH domain
MNFGEKIRNAREELSLRQTDVAAQIGMNQSNYSKIEQGKQEPNLQQLKSICEILHIDPNYLLNINGDDFVDRRDRMLLLEVKNLISKYSEK